MCWESVAGVRCAAAGSELQGNKQGVEACGQDGRECAAHAAGAPGRQWKTSARMVSHDSLVCLKVAVCNELCEG